MGTVTSTLLMQMLWNGSAAAKRAQADMKGVDAAANKLKGTRGAAGAVGGAAVIPGGAATQAAIIGGQKMLVGALAGYVAGGAAKQAFTSYADFDRRMTRIRQTADASVAESEQAKSRIRKVAQDVALPIGEVMGGVEDLVASGRSLGETMAFLPAVAKTAQASGAAVGDIAKTADAIGTSMGIAGDQMQRAFDILVQQGKAGKFELKDMAQYLPSLAPAAAAVGMKGVEGLNQLAAILQTVRTQSGTAGEAATAVSDIFAKMESQETAKKFTKFGIDLPKAMAKARKEGKNLFDTFLDLTDLALKGDLSKIPLIATDKEFARALRALTSNREAYRGFLREMANAGGAVERDLVAPVNDARAGVDRLANSWSRVTTSLGNLGDAAGATATLNGLSVVADDVARNLERALATAKKLAAGDFKGAGEALAADYGKPSNAAKYFAEGERQRLEAVHAARRAKAQEDARNIPGVIERRQRILDHIGEQEKRRRLSRDEHILRRDTEAEIASLKDRLKSLVNDTLPDLPEGPGAGPPALPYTGRVMGQRVSGATRARPRQALGTASAEAPPSQDVPGRLIVQLDDAAATAAANAAREKVQAILNANPPVIKPRVEMPSIPSASTAGSYSDNGGRR